MKRKILYAVLVISIIAGGAYYSTLSKRATIPDVSRSWEQHFSNPLGGFLDGQLRIELSGQLDAPAKLFYDGAPVELPAGKINHFIASPENWSATCRVRYEPITVSSGSLSVRVIIGYCPDWQYRRPTVGDPEPAGYTGGWTVYFPGSDRHYCDAAYFAGKRHGEWKYFDESGRLSRTELWQDGLRIR